MPNTTCRVLAALLGWLTFCLGLRAQGLEAWRLPVRGAAEYRRQWRGKASAPQRAAAAARAARADQPLPERYLHRLAPAPWLCQSELRDDQRALDVPVRDLRDVLRAVAADVGQRSGMRLRFPRLLPFGDVVVSGTWSAPAADGTQTLRATFAASPPAAVVGEGRDVLTLLKPFLAVDCAGSVTMTRQLDAGRGVVASWQGEFDLVVDEGERSYRRLVVADAHELLAVRDNQDADFRVRVVAAIERGVGWVREQLAAQKPFLTERGGDDRNYGSGRLALGLLTLLHGHVPPADAVVQRGFAELRKRKPDDSYSVAAALMAMAALHAPSGEAALLRDGKLAAPPARELPERDREVAQRWLQQLLRNVDPRGASQDQLRFNYTAGPRYDTSLQQYGLLGLWSAQVCGLELPPGAFAAAARQLLAVQQPAGKGMTLTLCSYAQQRAALGDPAGPRQLERRAEARGFAYQEATEPPFGSMTSAGISGLLLARGGMVVRGEVDRALQKQIDDAVADGYAWLASEFSVRANPGFAERADHHWYYWLYGLERSCELAGIAWLHGRDWYYEGALQLLSQQQENGSFRAEHPSTLLLDSTCFAILFLAKGTAAVPLTGRRD